MFRVIVAALLVSFVAHRGFYTRRAQRSADAVLERPRSGRATQIATFLALLALLSTLIYIFLPDWMAWSRLSLPIWLRWVGVGVALTGFGLLQWAQVTLGKNWSDAPTLFAGQAMIASGPYQWVRHPIYSSFLLILGSLLLISSNWCVGGLWLAMTALVVASRIRTEEALMVGGFGQRYQSYMRSTGRLFPRLVRQDRADT